VCTCGGLPAPHTVRNCTSAGATPLRAVPCGRLATSAGFNAPQPRPTGHSTHRCLPGGSRGNLGHAARPDNHATRPAAASAPPEMRGRPRYGRRATYSTSTTRASIRSQSGLLDRHDQSLDTVAERPTRPARPEPRYGRRATHSTGTTSTTRPRYGRRATYSTGTANPAQPQCGGLSAFRRASFSVPVPRGSSGWGVGSLPGGGSVVTRRRFGRGFCSSDTYCGWMIVIGSVAGLESTPRVSITRRATESGSLNSSKACTRR